MALPIHPHYPERLHCGLSGPQPIRVLPHRRSRDFLVDDGRATALACRRKKCINLTRFTATAKPGCRLRARFPSTPPAPQAGARRPARGGGGRTGVRWTGDRRPTTHKQSSDGSGGTPPSKGRRGRRPAVDESHALPSFKRIHHHHHPTACLV